MPAENDPAEPNALTQSLQLTCSLTPSNTVPSTRLVIIWLKRCLARSPIDAPLESAPVGVGEGLGDGEGLGEGEGVGVGEVAGTGVDVGLGEGLGATSVLAAKAGAVCASTSSNEIAAVSAADTTNWRMNLAIVSARTASRWGRCHRQRA
jgi:hypothetical protein